MRLARPKYAARAKQYYEENRDFISQRHKQWLTANADRVAKKSREWYQKNREHIRAVKQDYYRRRREEFIAYSKAWQEANPERVAQHRKTWNQSLRKAAHSSAYSARRRTQIGASVVDFRNVIARCGWICGICGNPVERKELSFDHIMPLSRGGQHTEDNLQVSHLKCNIRKGIKIG